MHGPTCVRDASFKPFRSQITSRKRRYGSKNYVGMFIFANTWIGEWEYNSDIDAIFALLNGLSLIFTHNLSKHVIVPLFSNLEKIFTIGRQDNPREVHTLDVRTGERSIVCTRNGKHTDITASVVRGKTFTCGGDRDICELYDFFSTLLPLLLLTFVHDPHDWTFRGISSPPHKVKEELPLHGIDVVQHINFVCYRYPFH